jgi:hypothetical protein
MKKFFTACLLASLCSVALAAKALPQVEKVKAYLSGSKYIDKAASCKGTYLTLGADVECWAAHTAKDLSGLPDDTRALVLDDAHDREAILSRCAGKPMEVRMKARECAAAGQADSFISLRLPRMKLEPLQFR